MIELIERKKRGEALSRGEIDTMCRGYLEGEVPDYQMAAWLMAVCWRGLSEPETFALTRALVESGELLDWSTDRPVVDKHSTGGVGDKTSIALVPLLASAGLTFVKMSGRGLGHTGGTLDKLESIPGFRVDLPLEELRAQVGRIGCALVGQSPQLVPADGALYALRDVTATVDSIPLIASSVMSKKIASGARAIVLDVKYGSGAFMRRQEDAEALARLMVAIGGDSGRRVGALVTPMMEPLGSAVGNALEVREAIEILHGGGPDDLRELVLDLGSHLMVLARVTESLPDARSALQTLLGAGVGADKLEQLIEAQHGDPRVVRDPARLPSAPLVAHVLSPTAGWLELVDARGVADTALFLGAGRQRKGDPIDSRTGVRILLRAGAHVAVGEPLAELHIASPEQEEPARQRFLRAVRISPVPPAGERRAPGQIGRE
jgi:pyrimidine-nucleoside phosphorylase